MHDTFLRVWQRRDRIDVDKLDGLVWTAALNLARNRLRWRKLWRTEALDVEWPDDLPGPEVVAENQVQQSRLHAALARLSARMREVILLGEFSGLSQADIAAILRTPPGTVASRRHHALRRLRVLLMEKDDD